MAHPVRRDIQDRAGKVTDAVAGYSFYSLFQAF